MSKFTDRLWREIVREHGADLRGVERPAARPHHRLTRVLAGTGLVGVAGAGATLALVLGAASTSPAFAVTRNNDGTYSVGLSAWSAIPAANARLRALGLRARLVGVESGCSAATAAVLPQRVVVPAAARAALAARAKIDPAAIPPGRILLVPAIHYGNIIRLAQAKAVAGIAPACLPTPAQLCTRGPAAAPLPGGPVTSTTGTTTDPTTTTGTATSATTTSTTGTGTTTTGTGTTPGKPQVQVPPGVIMRCFAPPPVFCRIHGAAGAAATSTTGTTTTGTTTTGTTTDAATTGTATSTTATDHDRVRNDNAARSRPRSRGSG